MPTAISEMLNRQIIQKTMAKCEEMGGVMTSRQIQALAAAVAEVLAAAREATNSGLDHLNAKIEALESSVQAMAKTVYPQAPEVPAESEPRQEPILRDIFVPL